MLCDSVDRIIEVQSLGYIYSCNILVICGQDNNLVWKSLQKKSMFFSRLHLNGNIHLKPTGLMSTASFGVGNTITRFITWQPFLFNIKIAYKEK